MCLSNIAIEALVASTGGMLGCSTRSCTPVINKQKHACRSLVQPASKQASSGLTALAEFGPFLKFSFKKSIVDEVCGG